jgi:alkaline phosphatase D
MFKVIASSVAWADDAKNEIDPGTGQPIAARDTWAGFPAEREEIFNYLADRRIEGVLLLSGDRHRADLRLNRRSRGYPLHELMCSWLTNPKGTPRSGQPLWEYTAGPCFAVLTFDTAAAEPALTMEVATIEGEPVLQRTLRLSGMSDL